MLLVMDGNFMMKFSHFIIFLKIKLCHFYTKITSSILENYVVSSFFKMRTNFLKINNFVMLKIQPIIIRNGWQNCRKNFPTLFVFTGNNKVTSIPKWLYLCFEFMKQFSSWWGENSLSLRFDDCQKWKQ